ncbi:MAG: peptide chain release factor N(5)-glutamine methyltransferase [Alphaproteobacteria bacterium]|nr:peptide chain release factor N(5)-glutamine methyltransferase [Alphaproteobacteria bacterium]
MSSGVARALKAAADRLSACSPSARLDARLLLAHAMGIEAAPVPISADSPLSDDAVRRFEAALGRRLCGEPVSRILGRRAFWTLDLAITPDVLDPRPDSEAVVEAVLSRLGTRDGALSLLDFGTGSGCLLLALLAELPNAWGLGVDRSQAALRVAAGNAAAHGLGRRARFLASDWDAALSGRYDVIVSNPPYLADREMETLAPEVRGHDPRLALSGGADGLEAYRKVLPALRRRLAPGGFAVLEVGVGQAAAVADMACRNDLRHIGSQYDLAGIERAVVLQLRHGMAC